MSNRASNFVRRLRRAAWTYRQPLTRAPSRSAAAISDLFVWRKGDDWSTHFELTDMAGLFASPAAVSAREIELRIFAADGGLIARNLVAAMPYQRTIVDISLLAAASQGDVGTFGVFHPDTPTEAVALGSHLAERGYVSYCYRESALRCYVHGNLDAASLDAEGNVELLAGYGVLGREYRLQHELLAGVGYEIGVVNPSRRPQEIACEIIALQGQRNVSTLTRVLPPGGCHLFVLPPRTESQRIVLHSKLVMARPLIYRFENDRLDVLHG